MGPEEYASREELGLVIKFLLTKIAQQGEILLTLAGMAATNGGITAEQFQALIAQTENSPKTRRAKLAKEDLESFLAMHNIVRLYQDPPEE